MSLTRPEAMRRGQLCLRVSFGAALAKFCSNVLSRWRGSSLSFWPRKTAVFTASGTTRFGMLLEPAAAQAEDFALGRLLRRHGVFQSFGDVERVCRRSKFDWPARRSCQATWACTFLPDSRRSDRAAVSRVPVRLRRSMPRSGRVFPPSTLHARSEVRSEPRVRERETQQNPNLEPGSTAATARLSARHRRALRAASFLPADCYAAEQRG